MSFMESVTGFITSIPKPVMFGVIILSLVVGFFIWKKLSSKSKEMDHKKDDDAETAPILSAVTKSYQKEVQKGLELETTTPPPVLEPFGGDSEAEYAS